MTEVTFPALSSAMLVEIGTGFIFGTEPDGDETMELSVASVVSGSAQDVSDTGIGTIRPYVCLGPFTIPNPDICDYRGRYLAMSHDDHGCLRYLPLPWTNPPVCTQCDDSTGTAVMRPPDGCDMAQDGELRCNGVAPEICRPDFVTGCMTWYEPTHMCIYHYFYCAEVQSEPTVVYSPNCNFLELGTTRCDDGNIEICLYGGGGAYTCGYRWRPLCHGTAPGDPGCPADPCDVTELDDLRCSGNDLQICAQNACVTYWTKEPTCPECNGGCDDSSGSAVCVPPPCNPASDDYRCVGDILEECVDDAQCGPHWRVHTDCRAILTICDGWSPEPAHCG